MGELKRQLIKHGIFKKKNLDLKIEVETRTIEDVQKVIEVGKGKVIRIMLDNFTPEQIAEALKLIGEDLKQKQAEELILIILKSLRKQELIM